MLLDLTKWIDLRVCLWLSIVIDLKSYLAHGTLEIDSKLIDLRVL